MGKKIVCYFSAGGTTKKVAEKLAQKAQADIYEIKPKISYTKDDLNWMDKKSRSSVEMADRTIRPEIIKGDINLDDYDTIYLGFPIWWGVAPTVVNTFLEAYDMKGKKIVVFATSGTSGMGDSVKELEPSAPGAVFKEGGMLNGLVSDSKLESVAALA